MIKFSLSCPDAHVFEAWFSNSDSFEAQKGRGDISCPVCGSADVEKALMAPSVVTARKRESVRVAAHVAEADMQEVVRKLRKHLTENAENVGDRFAEEARRIHYDEAEKRGIYGEATSEEVHALVEEGIEFHPLPRLPEDQN
jgi:hypothetical protein